MNLTASGWVTPPPARRRLERTSGPATPGPAPTIAELEAAALAALRAAGLPFDILEPGAGFRRHPRRDFAHLWCIANDGTGRTGRPWLQVCAGNPKEVGGVDVATFTWCSWKDHPGATLDTTELAEARQAIADQTRAAEARREQERIRARDRAAADWGAASPAGAEAHPYLTAKGVSAHGVRVAQDGALLVPVRDTDGTLHAVQRIDAQGRKRFTAGGSVTGHCHIIGTPTTDGRLYLCEGYATASTVHEVTGAPVAVSFNCGNLAPVARAIKAAHPRARLIVAGDDDARTPSNPGRTHAEHAAREVGAALVFPRFCDASGHPTDWNDLARLEGAEAVRAQLEGAAPAEPAQTGLRVVDMSRLRTAELQPPAFVVRPLIPRGYLTLFGGHGGSGKTSVALVLAAHVAAGRNWAGFDVRRGKVLFASFEDREGLTLWRLRNIADEYALSLPDIETGVAIVDASKALPIVVEASAAGVRQVVPSRDGEALVNLIRERRPDLVIVDNASDGFGADENSRAQVRAFVRYLVDAVEEHDGAVVLLAHVDKSAAKFGANRNSYSGSTAWHNSARSRLALVNNELWQEKLNVGKALEAPVTLAWTDRAVPVVAHGGTASTRTAAQEADDAALLACFDAAAQAGRNVPAADTGPSTTWHALSVYPECPAELRTNKARFREGVARLLRAGAVRAEEYRDQHRNHKTRLVVTDAHRAALVCVGSESTQTDANLRPYACVSSHRGVGINARTPNLPPEPTQPDPDCGLDDPPAVPADLVDLNAPETPPVAADIEADL